MSTGSFPKVRLEGEILATAPVLPPVPERLTVCGLPVALSVRVTAAVRVPVAVGVKVTLIVQLAPAATELPQVLVWAKSPGLVPDERDAGEGQGRVAGVVQGDGLSRAGGADGLVAEGQAGGGKTGCGWRCRSRKGSPSGGCRWRCPRWQVTAARAPLAEGVKVTLMVQLAPAATELPQLLVWAKSLALVPESAMLVRVKAALPELVRVTV